MWVLNGRKRRPHIGLLICAVCLLLGAATQAAESGMSKDMVVLAQQQVTVLNPFTLRTVQVKPASINRSVVLRLVSEQSVVGNAVTVLDSSSGATSLRLRNPAVRVSVRQPLASAFQLVSFN